MSVDLLVVKAEVEATWQIGEEIVKVVEAGRSEDEGIGNSSNLCAQQYIVGIRHKG